MSLKSLMSESLNITVIFIQSLNTKYALIAVDVPSTTPTNTPSTVHHYIGTTQTSL